MYVGGVVRGCGRRQRGGIYLELGLSPYGVPIEDFLMDPPNYAILEGGLHVPTVGAHLVEWAGVTHIFDHIGSSFYPNVADWIEEVRLYGISRRLPQSLEFGKLGRESRLFVIHSHAYIENVRDYWPYACPTAKEHQHEEGEACIGAVWQDLDAAGTVLRDSQTGECERTMPSFHYRTMLGRATVPVHRRPQGVLGKYRRAVFGVFPIGRLTIIGSPSDSDIARKARKVSEARLPLEFADD